MIYTAASQDQDALFAGTGGASHTHDWEVNISRWQLFTRRRMVETTAMDADAATFEPDVGEAVCIVRGFQEDPAATGEWVPPYNQSFAATVQLKYEFGAAEYFQFSGWFETLRYSCPVDRLATFDGVIRATGDITRNSMP